MFDRNMGRTDRIIRAILGLALLIAFFSIASAWKWLALVVALVLLATAIAGTCPPYSLLGIRTDRR